MQSPWGPPTSPHQWASLPQSCGQALSAFLSHPPSLLCRGYHLPALIHNSPPLTRYGVLGWRSRHKCLVALGWPAAQPLHCAGCQVLWGTARASSSLWGWHSATRATLAWPQVGSWEQAQCLPRPGLQTLCWMIWISLELQPSQAQRDCLHTQQMDYCKNTLLSLPKVPWADRGGHGL